MVVDKEKLMDEVVTLAKRRGFIYPGSDIYGGLANTWDYGPYGTLLKNNVKQAWWQDVVMKRADIVGLDSAILMNPKVWEASGHTKNFTDPLVEDLSTKKRYRADKITRVATQSDFEQLVVANFKDRDNAFEQVMEGYLAKMGEEVAVGQKITFDGMVDLLSGLELGLYFVADENRFVVAGDPKQFNLMFKTYAGPSEDTANQVYLRPETAQGIFVNFKNIVDTIRVKLPFGVAQIGKAFRNEITPGNFTFRTREFEQFEIEYFVKSKQAAEEVFEDWVQTRLGWYLSLGIKRDNLRLRPHEKDELAHYASAATDVEYEFPFGWSELEGIANRGEFDLKQHEEFSGQELRYFDEESKEKIRPYVIEPSGGVDRATLAFLVDAYDEDGPEEDKRKVLRLHPRLAPIKLAIFPLIKKEPLQNLARDIHERFSRKYFVEYDESGTVGKRYRRQDEIGTPFCITVDFEGVESEEPTVTIRHRDSMEQERVAVADLERWFAEKI